MKEQDIIDRAFVNAMEMLGTDRISHILCCLGIPKAELGKHLNKQLSPSGPGKSL